MKKCVLIYNSKSGKGVNKIPFDRVIDIVNSYGYELTIQKTRRKGHATHIIQELSDDVDLVIAAERKNYY